ncbi:sensor histidine kinase [Gordonia liuliyuniae]|uniref:histidine kinase n=1 Tax=Gordonia liuliyuniae TaxID=2911517 RepID=A0ABS9IRI5_9ACTN|nr:histidine kinase [Gordonia liuliyuniae]MCF8588168.1 sensor domain-containing protein [Gordonia liuliyuniae]
MTTDEMTATRSPWRALGRSPLRYLTSSDPWRGVAYTLTTLVLGCLMFLAYVVIVLLPFAPAWSNLLGKIDRQRVRLLGVPAIGDPHTPVDGNVPTRMGVRLGEPATWREVVYSLFLAIYAPLVGIGLSIVAFAVGVFAFAPVIARQGEVINLWSWTVESVGESWSMVPIALPLIIIGLYLSGVAAAITASIATWLLGPREEELAAQVAALESSRGVLVGSFEAERQRIERDLHDGPQQDLVGAAMQLGELAQTSDDPTLRTEVEAAQARVERALSGLRETVRGVNPKVLEDFGLEAACAELGDPISVRVLPSAGWSPGRRLPAPFERAMYYTASESVTNAVKHGRASSVTIELSDVLGVVSMVVTDDGVGGADPSRGSGLAGLVERAHSLGATLTVTSPRGGPTVLRWTGRAGQ